MQLSKPTECSAGAVAKYRRSKPLRCALFRLHAITSESPGPLHFARSCHLPVSFHVWAVAHSSLPWRTASCQRPPPTPIRRRLARQLQRN